MQRQVDQVRYHIKREKKLTGQNQRLEKENETLRKDLLKAYQDNNKLQGRIDLQNQKIAALQEDLRIAKLPVNSSNSSLPPSGDLYKPRRKNYSLRKKTGRKPGGQQGHKGSTLLFDPASPNSSITHDISFCSACGNDLRDVSGELKQTHQVIDIAIPKKVITNHTTLIKQCTCGHCNQSEFPGGVKGKVNYGNALRALVVNLQARQYVPYKRTVELINDIFGIPISEGTVANLLEQFEGKAKTVYQHIQQQIPKDPVAGSDETGAKVNGKKGWFHTYQNPEWTFIGYHPSRGIVAREHFYPKGLPNTILVSDCLAMQLGTPAAKHQACMVHLLRELHAMEEAHPNEWWPAKVKELFLKAMNLKEQSYSPAAVKAIEQEFKQLLTKDQLNAPGKIPAFFKRMVKHEEKIFTFLHHHHVPSHNNESEKSIRNVKVKQKVSGQFKTQKGAYRYAMNRSIIDTLNKQGKNVHNGLKQIAVLDTG